jgi:hypothetical protein
MKMDLALLSKSDFANLKLDVQKLDNKLQTEAANFRAMVEQMENRFIRYAIGIVTTGITLGLGAWRVFKT